jgi:hypothetical protein
LVTQIETKRAKLISSSYESEGVAETHRAASDDAEEFVELQDAGTSSPIAIELGGV